MFTMFFAFIQTLGFRKVYNTNYHFPLSLKCCVVIPEWNAKNENKKGIIHHYLIHSGFRGFLLLK